MKLNTVKMIRMAGVILFLLVTNLQPRAVLAGGYENFNVAIYARVYETQKMSDLNWMEKRIDYLQQHIKIDKVYMETYRDMILADKETIIKAKKLLEKKGIRVSGGITLVMHEANRFKTFCYSNGEHLEEVKKIVEYTAELFDEVMLDDFFFTSCKCELCIKNKGDKSWTDFRLELLKDVSENIILKTARETNPDVKMIIKYPNWYEHYQYLGYNLEHEPELFDMIYTGTETRDPEYTHQHLQQYQSYSIMRYLENVSPGKNAGGWIDPYARRCLDRYGEQISLTLFAKPKEVTLFCLQSLVEEMENNEGSAVYLSNVTPLAGYVLAKADNFIDKLGNPTGIPAYKPYHSSGEDFLHNYLGMLGIPVDITPDFPYKSNMILLTESAKYDTDIVKKIKTQLTDGKNVVITSGLLGALQGKGIEDIAELRCTDKKALAHRFSNFRTVFESEKDILIPQIIYPTNDCWELVTAYSEGNGYPLLLQAGYGNSIMYVLTIPDNFGDLYNLPESILTMIKNILMKDMYVSIESRSRISLFVYDNNTFIVHSFLPHREQVKVAIKEEEVKLRNLTINRILEGVSHNGKTEFSITISPHSYQVFKVE
ncbi:MAG: hypothetical protein JSV22_02545 [Bacteroidales bacterium]|nr:MAG: hypothetical protein JSV22_02545 [Bacteroidales bacterium]